MIRLQLEQTDDVIEAINKIRGLVDLNIELIIPEGSIIFENYLNLKLIQEEADKMEKSVDFYTEDEFGNNLIMALNGKPGEPFIQNSVEEEPFKTLGEKRKIHLPKIHLPKVNIKIPNFITARKKVLFIILPLIILITGYIIYGLTTPKVTAKISVHSQSLTRSVTIRVKSGATTDITAKVLKGSILSSTVDITKEADTTGTKIIGEKAKGEVTIYNKTTSSVTLSKGTKLTYKEKSTDLTYTLDDSATIPAASSTEPSPGTIVITAGESAVNITASDIGDSYNISDLKSLDVKGYDKSDVEAKTKDDVTGGKSETVKVVAAGDLTGLSNIALAEATTKATEYINNKLDSNQKLIAGSVQTKVAHETFNKSVGDQVDKISITQSVSADGLIYLNDELNKFLDEYVKDRVPEGFVLSSQSREVSVEVLGNSTSSVLTSTEADLQVTLKTFVVPDIKEEDIKKELAGKTPSEAEKILSSIKNVNSYEFKLNPSIPFFGKVPIDLNRIEITIERN
jgi:hypothetical protein